MPRLDGGRRQVTTRFVGQIVGQVEIALALSPPQLGKTLQADGVNDGELKRQVTEPTDVGESQRIDPDAP